MEIIEKETKGKSFHTYKYSYDSIGLPAIDYDDDSSKVMKWQDTAETIKHTKSVNIKPLADQIIGSKPLLSYFLDGSRHVFKVDDIAYNKCRPMRVTRCKHLFLSNEISSDKRPGIFHEQGLYWKTLEPKIHSCCASDS